MIRFIRFLLLDSQSGIALIEMVIALTLLGITITGLLFGVSTGVSSEKTVEDVNTASSLARSQIEHTLAQTYIEPPVYPTITGPAGYSISFSNSVVTSLLLEKISVTVSNPQKALVTLDAYKTNTAYVAGPPALLLSQVDFRWYQNINDRNPVTPLAAQNTAITAAAPNQIYRLRMNVSVSGLSMPITTQSFKLQYSNNAGGPWNDVGSIGSGIIWRGYDNSIPADGVTITTLLLSTSNVMESYEEQNPSSANPNALAIGQFGEWDWVIQENNATPNTIYYFRMVKSDGTALDSYTQNVPITTAPSIAFTQKDYRWYSNIDSITPVTSLASEDTAISSVVPGTILRVRANIEIGGANLVANTQSLKLQYSTSQSGPWTDVGASGSGAIWRGFNNPTPTDGAAISGLLLSTSNVLESYEEENPSALNPNTINVGQRGEWDWVVQNNGATGNTIFYFRMVKADGAALDSYMNYPQVTTAPLSLTQQDYRLYANSNSINPISALANEDTPYSSLSHGQVYRIRMNVAASGAYLFLSSQAFKLQFATATLGPWTDLGGIGSGVMWRGYDNPGPSDGSTITSLLLSTSNVAESYEEANPSVLNPNAILAGQRGEWDWVAQDNNATASTTFYFQMVKSDGTVLDGYVNYPRINIPPVQTITQQNYRWYANVNALNPVTPLAVENTSYASASLNTVFRLRMNIQANGLDLATSAQAFKLQYSTSTLGPWTDLGAIGSLTTWRGYDNPTPTDGGTITATLLASSTVTETYDEQNSSPSNPLSIPVSGRGEWDWVIQDNLTTGGITYYFRMVKADSAPLDSYVNYGQITTAPQSLTQQDYRWYTNIDNIMPTPALAAQDTPFSAVAHNQTYRIRMNVGAGGIQLSGGSLFFKLQYATSAGGFWADVGAIGSTATWRGFDNPTPADGATLPGLLLSTSNVMETYEEQNPSVSNPNAINIGQNGEWDWVVQDNGAASTATYLFRMVKGDGSLLDAYTNYPQISIPPPLVLTQEDYRWYPNRNNQTPISPLAAENTSITGITLSTVLRIRMNMSASEANLPAGFQDFKLQYATSTGGPWTDAGAIGSLVAWRGFNNGTPADGVTLTSLLLSTTTPNVFGSYEEQNPSVLNPTAINTGQRGEWDWVVQNFEADANTIYYFRMAESDGTALSAYTNYPQLTTSPQTLTQHKYRWYANINNRTPTTPLALEDTATTAGTHNLVYRIRVNVEVGGTALPAGSQSFKLQYATGTGGPWGDVGAIGATTSTWTGFDNASPVDGVSVAAGLLLSDSNVQGSYEEENPSVANPNSISAGLRGEWDWVVQDYSAPAGATFYFRLITVDGSPLDSYLVYPQITLPPPLVLTQQDYRWYANANSVTPTPALAAQNVAITGATIGTVYRIRLNAGVTGANLPVALQAFNLQYSTGVGGPWTDVGAIGSASIWRGFNNATPADGANITSLLLSTSNVLESYEEQNPSVVNPNALNVGLKGEWDWVVQNNGADGNTTYFFRMVKSNGTALDIYTNYPQVTTSSITLTQQDYRWYANTNALNPSTPLAGQDVATSGQTLLSVVRIRMNMGVTLSNLSASLLTFKLQYATGTGGPWTDIGAIGATNTAWRGFDNAAPVDGATITSLLLTGSNVAESYEEQNPSALNPNAINAGQRGEWDWVIQDYSAADNTTYYFRMAKADGTDLDSYINYPQITTALLTVTQQDYRWYANTNAITPVTSISPENTATTAAAHNQVFRLRMNIQIDGSTLAAGAQAFKLQFSTNIAGPWTDAGAIGSGAIWRGFDNTTPADGATLPSLLLSTSNVLESYEEANPSVVNPNAINAGQRGEWDWVVQDNGAANNTAYYFQIVKADGSSFDSYIQYPQIIMPGPIFLTQQDYRWYANANAIQPVSPLAAEDTIFNGAIPSTVYRIRMNVGVSGSNLLASLQAFKLQFATDIGGPWTDAGAIGSGAIWRGFDNSTPADGATITSVLLSTSNVVESYEEANPSVLNPNTISQGQAGEWDWVVQNNNADRNTDYVFRMVLSDGTPLDFYNNYPEIITSPIIHTQQDYRWYANINNITPATALAAQDTATTASSHKLVYRLRMNVQIDGSNLPAALEAFKLQYASSTLGPWVDVGSISSGIIFEGYDNPTPVNGTTLPSLLLTGSSVLETYQEQNPSSANPNGINIGQRGEWDWVVRDNGAPDSTTFYFRMTVDNGTALETYNNYPQLTTAPPLTFTQQDYRWYANNNNLTPVTALAAQDSAITGITSNTVLRIRMNLQVGGADLPSAMESFKLQYATSAFGLWTDVGAIGSVEIWSGFNNATPADGATLPSLLLTGSNVAESYQEQNPSVNNPNALLIGRRGEWDWVVQNNGADGNTIYLFRMVKSDGTVLTSYVNFPQLTTNPFTLTQQSYRWYANINNITPTTPLAAENTATSASSHGLVYRIRMNVQPDLSGLGAGVLDFKLQYNTSTTAGVWSDVGGIGSATIWRGFSNPGPNDGATIPSVLLSTSNQRESYEDSNPSVNDPRAITAGQRGEWDWVVQDNGAADSTAYYFRMVKSSGLVFDVYNSYPAITTAPPLVMTQQDYRWYVNVNGTDPATPLAAQNTAYTNANLQQVVRLRINLSPSGANLAAGTRAFKLQYSTSTGGPWSDAGGIGSAAAWRGFDNATPVDGAAIATLLLSTSNVLESYEEQNPSVSNPNAINIGQRGEWDWVVQNNNAITNTTYYFRIVRDDGTPLNSYTNYPRIDTAPLTFAQQDYRWYSNINVINPTTPLAAQDTLYTSNAHGLVYRLRVNLAAGGSNLPASFQDFKLQYATSTGGTWNDIGAIGSGSIWRGFDNAAPADGATITTLLLSTSNVLESYEEQNLSVVNPTAINNGQLGEWDWVIQDNGAASNTSYYFRMVKSDGTTLNSYVNYPQLTTPPDLTFTQQSYRWYANINAVDPTIPVGSENTATTADAYTRQFRLRMNIAVGGTNLTAGQQSFKLQYALSVLGPWTDLGFIGYPVDWRGYDNLTPADGASITTLLLSTSNVLESYEEENPTALNPFGINIGQRGEWDWVIENNSAASVTTYYFRMVKADGTPLDTYVSYPQMTTPLPVIAQDDFESGGISGGTGWNGDWTLTGLANVTGLNGPYQGSYHLRLRSSTGYGARSLNLSGKTTVRAQFWAKAFGFNPGQTATFSISPDGVNWTLVKTWVYGEDDNVYRFWDFDLSSYSHTSTFWIAYQANMSAAGQRLMIDWLKIVGQ